MAKDWNEQGFFSGITEDYSNYTWFKGESKNPYTDDQKRPLAASFWEYEREFHMNYLDHSETKGKLNFSVSIYQVNHLTHSGIRLTGQRSLKKGAGSFRGSLFSCTMY